MENYDTGKYIDDDDDDDNDGCVCGACKRNSWCTALPLLDTFTVSIVATSDN